MSSDNMKKFRRHSLMVGNALVNLRLNKQRDIMEVHWNPSSESISNRHLPLTYFQVVIQCIFAVFIRYNFQSLNLLHNMECDLHKAWELLADFDKISFPVFLKTSRFVEIDLRYQNQKSWEKYSIQCLNLVLFKLWYWSPWWGGGGQTNIYQRKVDIFSEQ